MSYVQAAILILCHPYLRSTTILIDISESCIQEGESSSVSMYVIIYVFAKVLDDKNDFSESEHSSLLWFSFSPISFEVYQT